MVLVSQTHIYAAQHTGPALSRPQQSSELKALGGWACRPKPAFILPLYRRKEVLSRPLLRSAPGS